MELTFLFTDIEGSTSKWERDPEAMGSALMIHDRISNESIDAAGGTIFKMTGDGIAAAFEDADSAVQAALSIRARLADQNWPPAIGSIRVRMGIHSGLAEEREGDYFGPTLNRVGRLMSAGHGGQILISQATRELLQGTFAILDLGEHGLRDLLRPEHIYQIGESGEDYPPLRTLNAHNHNLPVQVTPFVGREQEISDLKELIPHAPLVTLTGPGGTGKTRLALQAAAELVGRFEGVFFVPLASIRNPDNVAPAIGDVLGLQLQDADPARTLAAHLAPRRYLLILDNFEQVMPVADLVGELADVAKDLRVLVTSRELLRLRAERNYPVPPLALPPETSGISTTDLTGYEALRLFEIRARAVQPDFVLDESNVDDVSEICRRVDGLPLAIELAAARIRLMSAAQLKSALGSDLGSLGRGPRDAPKRQQTLLDTIGWSYDLLDESEKRVFRRLGIFVAGCTFEALEAVAMHDTGEDPMVMAEALADKSLARIGGAEDDEPRVEMLETIRSFARSELEAGDELVDLSQRHAAYFARLAEAASPQIRGRDQEIWVRRLDVDRANIRSALTWAFEGGDATLGLRIVAALRDYWFYQGQLREMGRWADEAMTRVGGQEPDLQAGVLMTAGFHGYSVYRMEAADLIKRAAQLYESAGDDANRALALIFEAGARENVTGDMERSRIGLAEGIELARSVGATPIVASGLTLLGELERKHGNFDESRRIQMESLTLARETGELRRVAMVLNNLGLIAHQLGDEDTAHRMIAESLRLSDEIGFEANSAHCLIALAEQLAIRGDPERGARLIGAADAYFDQLGLVIQPGDASDFDRIRADIEAAMGTDTYEVVTREGRGLQLDEAVELALSSVPPA